MALTELETLRGGQEWIERLENDAATLLEYYVGMIPEALDGLTPKERHSIYMMLRLKVVVYADGRVEVTGVFGGPMEPSPTRPVETEVMWLRIPEVDRTAALGFRALLTEGGDPRVQLHRA